MEVTVTKRPEKSQAELEVTVPAQDFQPYIERAAAKLTKDKPLKGFRPGKAPLDVVVKTFGHEHLLREAMDEAVPRFFVRAVVEHEVEAINRPSITIKELALDKPLVFAAIVEVLPEVKLGDPAALTVTKQPVQIDDAELEKELQYIARMRSSFLEVARPAQKGDVVTVDFAVTMNGVPMEGGSSKNHPVHLGEGHFVPDFEQKITGITAGEERAFEINFPGDYAQAQLRSKTAQVQVKAHNVQKRVLPEVNDEFAKSVGKFKDLQHLKDELKKNMLLEKQNKEKDRYQAELLAQLADSSAFGPIPGVLIEREIDQRIEELQEMLSFQQKTLDDYLRGREKTIEEIRQEMRPVAEKAVKVALAAQTFAQEHDISVASEEVDKKASEYAARFKTVGQASEATSPDQLREQVTTQLRNQKTLAKLEELASVDQAPSPQIPESK